METNVKEDLSSLTTINESVFTKLINKVEWCISDCVEKSILNGDSLANIDLDIGNLLISFDNNQIKYKFIPSQKLEKAITNTVVNERNDLVLNIEESLVSKLVNTYKNFF